MIKTYENFTEQNYQVDDYIITWGGSIGQILSIEPNMNPTSNVYNTELLLLNDKMKELVPVPLVMDNIKRLATPEEIEKFELEKSTNKYNL